MNRPTCDTCPYWDNDNDRENDVEGLCRRLAPPPTLEALIGGGDKEMVFRIHPFTERSDWCGEHPGFPSYIRSLGVPSFSEHRVLTGG